jgi:hypothetical protein
MRALMITAVWTLALLLQAPLLAQEPPKDNPPGPGPEARPPDDAAARKQLDERRKAYMEQYTRRLSDIQKEETTPEREEILRLEDLKKEYKAKLEKSQENLERSKTVVVDSFKELVNRVKTKDEIEQRCEGIWLTYLSQSRDYKSEVYEYTRALKGLDRRVNFVKLREAERTLPALGDNKYYKADDLEVYEEDEGADPTLLDSGKTHVSYYAMLKDFVLQMSGGGRGNEEVIERMFEEPRLVKLWKQWKKSAPAEK